MATVTFDGVSKRFGDVVALNDLNLQIRDEEFLVLVGPSGCSKTPRSGCWRGSTSRRAATSTSASAW